MITGQDRLSWRLLVVPALVAAVLLTVLATLVWLLGLPDSDLLWTVSAVAVLAPLLVWTAEDLVFRRVGGSMFALPVVAGALLLGQDEVGTAMGILACAGHGLEVLAWRRAQRDLTVLAGYKADRAIATGEQVRVETGEVVPVDGRLLADAVLDEMPLSGDPIPVLRRNGELVRSGVINVGDHPVELVATVPDTEGTWAAMSKLARRAISDEAARMPTGPTRRVERMALVFVPIAIVAAAVVWLMTGNTLAAFGVLAVATPGPLLLAGPLSLTAGVTKAARQGVVVGDTSVLVSLGRARVGVIDSAGVVTLGTLSVTEVVAAPGYLTNDVLALAASVQRFRPDALAGAVVRAAKAAGVRDNSQAGKVIIGETQPESSADWVKVALARAALDGAGLAWVSVDGQPAGALLVRDEVRPEAADSLRRLRSAGVRRLVLVTRGNLNDPEDVGELLGVDELWTGCGTADKVERVREERRRGITLMVGDDPAVGAADVGVALSGRGTCVADVLIADGMVVRLADAVRTARRSRRIAAVATVAGVSLVLAGMGMSAMGWLAPLLAVLVRTGAEALSIGLALRALAPTRTAARLPLADHDHLRPVRLAVSKAAAELSTGLTPQAQQSVLRAYHLMSDHVVPLQRSGDIKPGGLKHGEIEQQVRRLGTHLAAPNAQVEDLRATMYGLNAVLSERFISHPASLQYLQDPR